VGILLNIVLPYKDDYDVAKPPTPEVKSD